MSGDFRELGRMLFDLEKSGISSEVYGFLELLARVTGGLESYPSISQRRPFYKLLKREGIPAKHIALDRELHTLPARKRMLAIDRKELISQLKANLANPEFFSELSRAIDMRLHPPDRRLYLEALCFFFSQMRNRPPTRPEILKFLNSSGRKTSWRVLQRDLKKLGLKPSQARPGRGLKSQ